MKKIKLILIFTILLSLALNLFGTVYAAEKKEETGPGSKHTIVFGDGSSVEIEESGWYANAACKGVLIPLGDGIIMLLESLVGNNVTITNLVYNKVASVNPNFFDENNMGKAHVQITEAVSEWFIYFRKLAISVYLICLLMIGVRVVYNSTPEGINKAKSLGVEWLKGFLYLMLMPYGIWMLFKVNEALVDYICQLADGQTYTVGGSVVSDGQSWSDDVIEFRSPEYVSVYTGTTVTSNGDYKLRRIDDYTSNVDLMKIARAFAGVSLSFGDVFIWYVLIGQLISFIYIYYKRYFMISFLIAIFPVMCIFQAIGIMKDGRARAIQGWLGELISNIFLQLIHAIVYSIITAIVFKIFLKSFNSPNGTFSWLIIIMAVNFVPEGEKLLRRILKSLSTGSSVAGADEGGIKKGFRSVVGGARQIGGAIVPRDGGGGGAPKPPPPQ